MPSTLQTSFGRGSLSECAARNHVAHPGVKLGNDGDQQVQVQLCKHAGTDVHIEVGEDGDGGIEVDLHSRFTARSCDGGMYHTTEGNKGQCISWPAASAACGAITQRRSGRCSKRLEVNCCGRTHLGAEVDEEVDGDVCIDAGEN